jgi:NAD(P)-dependent dehydrogenase (short-subunit alcohol dehydrogenase family)
MTQDELIKKRLEGKIAVITGGNSGIGFATAQRFVQEGAFVFITGRRQDELDKAVKQIGRNAMGVQGDVSNVVDLDRLYGILPMIIGIYIGITLVDVQRAINCKGSKRAGHKELFLVSKTEFT